MPLRKFLEICPFKKNIMREKYHQISAFVAAKEYDGYCMTGFTVYDMTELLRIRIVKVVKETALDAILLSTWSAVHWVASQNISIYPLSVYSSEKESGNILSKAWFSEGTSDSGKDERIHAILEDCSHVASVAFGLCLPDEGGAMADYAGRMKALIDLLTR